MLGAGAVLATLAAAPALLQASTPIRTLYIAKPGQTLPQTTFVGTRDCLRRPRTCVNGIGGRELVYLTKGRMPARATTATVVTDTNCAAAATASRTARTSSGLPQGGASPFATTTA